MIIIVEQIVIWITSKSIYFIFIIKYLLLRFSSLHDSYPINFKRIDSTNNFLSCAGSKAIIWDYTDSNLPKTEF